MFWFSCMATADGVGVDPSYLGNWKSSHEGTLGSHRSCLQFGDACPAEADWRAWKGALQGLLAGNWRFATGLGRYTGRSPRVWRTFYNADESQVEVRTEDGLRVYRHLGQRRLGSRRYSATDGVSERKTSVLESGF